MSTWSLPAEETYYQRGRLCYTFSTMATIKRILVTGGAGFLGSHLCERLVERGPRRHLPRQLLHQPEDQRRPPARAAELRADPARHHAADLAGGRRDLQPRLPRRARPLPVQPDQDDEDLGHGGDQRAGHGQALPGEGPAGLDQRGLRRPRGPSAAGELPRQRQSDRPAGLLRRRQAGGRNALHGLPPHEQRQHPHRADLQHLRPADAPLRRPRGLELHPPGPRGRRHHDLRRRPADPLVLLSRRSGRRA